MKRKLPYLSIFSKIFGKTLLTGQALLDQAVKSSTHV